MKHNKWKIILNWKWKSILAIDVTSENNKCIKWSKINEIYQMICNNDYSNDVYGMWYKVCRIINEYHK